MIGRATIRICVAATITSLSFVMAAQQNRRRQAARGHGRSQARSLTETVMGLESAQLRGRGRNV